MKNTYVWAIARTSTLLVLLVVLCTELYSQESQKAKFSRPDGTHTVYYKNGEEQHNEAGAEFYKVIKYKDGKPSGTVTIYRISGAKSSEGMLLAENPDVENGLWKYYFQNGNIKWEANYKNGLKNGKHISYYENGNPRLEGAYKNDKMDGKWIKYYDDGKKSSETEYRDNIKCGKSVAWYASGKMKEDVIFTDNNTIRSGTKYRENGVKEITYEGFVAKDGRTMAGVFTHYDAQGEKEKVVKYTDGRQEIVWTRYSFKSEGDVLIWLSKSTWSLVSNDPNNTMNIKFEKGRFREWGSDPNQSRSFDDYQAFRFCSVEGATFKIARMDNENEYGSVCNYHTRGMYFTRTSDNTMELKLEAGGGTMKFVRH